MKQNFMTLMYRSVETDRVAVTDKITAKPEDYYAVINMPLIELLSVTRKEEVQPIKVIEELIELTSTVEWQNQLRRPLKIGDIICIGLQSYMLISDMNDHAYLKDENVVVLPSHKGYSIKLLPNFFKDNKCKTQP